MYDRSDLVKAVGQIARNAVEASMPTTVMVGRVENESPLTVIVEQRLTLTQKQLIVPERLTSHAVIASVDTTTEMTEGHQHSISGDKKITLQSSLGSGDFVLLLRMQGGQKYVVLDRLEGADV